ncbi:MAG: NAD-binding protein [Candidatus Enteromonas sp.]|nr:NAD-binding protein [Candidatus Enteromonas sp.]MDY6093646.1 NAD-binding protein [Candidatus Enteromonas sp.]
MKIVVAGGDTSAEFIVSMFSGKGNELIVVNGDRKISELLLRRCRVSVTNGEPWRKYILDEAGAYDADVFISLCQSDTDNFGVCLLAKKVFNAKKVICVVNNPKNVDLYKQLGIDSVLSSTYLLAESIQSESSVESLVKTLSIDNNKIAVTEFTVLSKHRVAHKKIRDIKFPTSIASIAAIKRNFEVIIPSGEIELLPLDVLLFVCSPKNASKVTSFLKKEVDRESLKGASSGKGKKK